MGRGGTAERVSFRPLGGNEGYGACPDEGLHWFRRGCGGGNSGRMRPASQKWATYKLKNDDNVVLAAA